MKERDGDEEDGMLVLQMRDWGSDRRQEEKRVRASKEEGESQRVE